MFAIGTNDMLLFDSRPFFVGSHLWVQSPVPPMHATPLVPVTCPASRLLASDPRMVTHGNASAAAGGCGMWVPL
jgi:hypothetical protein